MFDAAVGAVGWQGMLNTTVSGPTVFVAQEQGDTLAAYCYPFAVRKRKLAAQQFVCVRSANRHLVDSHGIVCSVAFGCKGFIETQFGVSLSKTMFHIFLPNQGNRLSGGRATHRVCDPPEAWAASESSHLQTSSGPPPVPSLGARFPSVNDSNSAVAFWRLWGMSCMSE